MSITANSRWNLLGFGCMLAAHLITVPMVIERIGLGEFGRAGLVLAVWTPLLVGTVLGNSVIRLVSSATALVSGSSARKALNNALYICLPACLAIGTIVVGGAPWLIASIASGSQPITEWRLDFALAGIGWVAQQYALVLLGASTGQRNYRAVAFVNACTAAINVVAVLLVTKFFASSSGYLAAISIGFAANMLLWMLVIGRMFGFDALRHKHHRNEMGSLLHFSKWQAISQVTGTIGNQVDRYILGAIASPVMLGKFNAAFRLQEAVYALVMKGGEVLFPYFGTNSAREQSQQAEFFARASWVTMVFSSALLAPAIPFAMPIITLWAGPEAAEGGASFLQVLILGGVIGCGSNVATYYFMGSGHASRLAWVAAVYSASLILTSAVLLFTWGPVAAGVGIAVASVVRVGHSTALIRRDFGDDLSAWTLFCSTMAPMLIALLIAGILLLSPISGLYNWLAVGGAYGLTGLAIVASCFAFAAMSRSGRDWLAGILRVIKPNQHA